MARKIIDVTGRRLIVVPEVPGDRSGYQIAVSSDLRRLCVARGDVVVVCAEPNGSSACFDADTIWVGKKSASSAKGLASVVLLRAPAELAPRSVKGVIHGNPVGIFCGDSVVYRAMRQLFPGHHLSVRMHNVYLRRREFRRKLALRTGVKDMLLEFLMARLEQRIIADKNVSLIAITEEEHGFLQQRCRSSVGYWPIDMGQGALLPKSISARKLVWLGSVSAHKRCSLEQFVSVTWPLIRRRVPDVELLLYGAGTKFFHGPERGIIGHGRYEGDDLPLDGRAIFINPEVLPGGIKLKVGYLLARGAQVISTSVGAEGYDRDAGRGLVIAPLERWPEVIVGMLGELA